MTAEQLEELLAACALVDHENYSPEFEKLHRIAPSLARRVIAAEKLVEAYTDERAGFNDWWEKMDSLVDAYREASK